MRYYDTTEIRTAGAHYNFVIGERSNGKTTAVLRDIIEDWHKTGRHGAIVRQMEEDIKGHKGASLFSGVVAGDMVSELTEGKYHRIHFRNRAYHMVSIDDDGVEHVMKEPFAHIFAVSQAVHYKSNSYPNVGTIMFDEFMRADHVYLVDEVVQFLNLVSTIVREKADATIFLIANTVSWNSPYFKKFGLKDIAKMSPGDLATFDYKKKRSTGEDIVMKVAVEYCTDTSSYGGKASDVYFVVDDERVNMITDGNFAIPEYPRCPRSFDNSNVKCTYWMHLTDGSIIRSRLIKAETELFVFSDFVEDWVYQRIRDERRDIFYSTEFSAQRNHYTCPIVRYSDDRTRYLVDAFAANRMFFENNEVGENLMYFAGETKKRSIMTL